MQPGISLITLGISDLTRARAFYERMGFEASSASVGDVVFFKSGGAVLALYPKDLLAEDALAGAPAVGFAGITLAHNVPNKEDVAAVLNEAKNAGGKITKPAQDTFWGGHHGYFTDPDGYTWEVAWNPGFEMNGRGEILLPG